MIRKPSYAGCYSCVTSTELLFPIRLVAAYMKHVVKHKARPRSISQSGENLGLWVDYALLRKHQGRTPQTIIFDRVASTNNRYLELADIALGNKSKKKNKDTAA